MSSFYAICVIFFWNHLGNPYSFKPENPEPKATFQVWLAPHHIVGSFAFLVPDPASLYMQLEQDEMFWVTEGWASVERLARLRSTGVCGTWAADFGPRVKTTDLFLMIPSCQILILAPDSWFFWKLSLPSVGWMFLPLILSDICIHTVLYQTLWATQWSMVILVPAIIILKMTYYIPLGNCMHIQILYRYNTEM